MHDMGPFLMHSPSFSGGGGKVTVTFMWEIDKTKKNNNNKIKFSTVLHSHYKFPTKKKF